jgi:hypothetical protein
LKRWRAKLSVGLLGVALGPAVLLDGCGSGQPEVVCGQACAAGGEDAGDADSSTGGSSGTAGSGGTSGSAGTDGSATGGSAGSGGSVSTGGTAGSGGSVGTSGSSGTGASGGTSPGDAAADSTDSADAGPCDPCGAYSAPSSAGNIANPAILELSGLAASHTHPGVFYAHNDSGDSARFFAFDGSGNTIGQFVLQGITAVDWEDMTVGPCPAGSCLFFGDIGDNNQQRANIAILRVTEPDVSVGSNLGTVNVAYDRFEYTYAPGPQNAEALLSHPLTGNLYIVTKSSTGTSLVFRIDAPASPGASQTLQTLVDLPLPTPGGRLVTGGAIHPCGERLLLRTYDALLEYSATSAAAFETAFTATPRSVPVATEAQGEAVTYQADGRGYVTSTEGRSPPLSVARCQ